MEKVDVAIVGAGIAGCHAARDLARAGHSVLVAERRKADHLGHDWWDSVALAVFPEVGLDEPQPPERLVPTGEVNVISPLGGIEFVSPAPVHKTNIDRVPFAARQLSLARQAGARVVENAFVLGPLMDGDAVAGFEMRLEDGSRETVRAKITIDASGMVGALRSKLPESRGFTRRVDRRDMFVTWREIWENREGRKDSSLVFGRDNGVFWVKRDQPGLCDYFAGVINIPGRPSPRMLLQQMLLECDDAKDGKMVRGGYGAPIPVRREFDSLVRPGFLLCGDSGCQCSPIDGSGIASSLRAARFAALTIHEALENNRVDEQALWPYVAAYKRTQGAEFAKLDFVQKFMVGTPKPLVELLFTKKVMSAENFWRGPDAPPDTMSKRIRNMLRLYATPKFMLRLAKVYSTAEKFEKHYRRFPETYDIAAYEAWTAEAARMFKLVDTY